ncbi:MAG: SLC13 family permease [Acidimicrobiales bacterium]
MSAASTALGEIAPALAFLLLAVPLAALLDELGLFEAIAAWMQGRWPELPVAGLWALAAGTTVVLNLDTTVVLLGPLYLRLARRSGVDPLPLALVPLLLAAFASSVLPVSNLTTLIAAERLALGAGEVVAHLGLPSLAAVVVGWFAYRRRHPARLPAPAVAVVVEPDGRALRIGGAVVGALLVAFTAGAGAGLSPWIAVLVADIVLVAVVKRVPWREVPRGTALGVAAIAAALAEVLPPGALDGGARRPRSRFARPGRARRDRGGERGRQHPGDPRRARRGHRGHPGLWAWLVGVNVGSVLLPIGALANLLWRRIVREDGIELPAAAYARAVVPLALAPLAAATLVAALTLGR